MEDVTLEESSVVELEAACKHSGNRNPDYPDSALLRLSTISEASFLYSGLNCGQNQI